MSQITQLIALAALVGGLLLIGRPQQAPPPPVTTVEEPAPTRTRVHRDVHRVVPRLPEAPPDVATPPPPKPALAKKRVKTDKRERAKTDKRETRKPEKRERPKAAKQRSITASECRQLRGAVAKYGYTVVLAGAFARGHSEEQLNQALAACGISS